jgi:hypothetical protein
MHAVGRLKKRRTTLRRPLVHYCLDMKSIYRNAFLFIWSCFLVIVVWFVVREPTWIPTDVARGIGRGGRALNVHVPSQLGRDTYMITVYSDGRATYWIPQPKGVFNNAELELPASRSEIQAVLALRSLWCQSRPQSQTLPADVLRYDIGYDCPGMPIRTMTISADSTPTALATLIRHAAAELQLPE